LFQFLTILLIIGLFIPDVWIIEIWKGQNRKIVLTAFIAVFMQYQIWTLIAQIGESQRLTDRVQKINVSIASIHLLIIGFLFINDYLSLTTILYLIAIEFLFAFLICIKYIPIVFSDERVSPKQILNEYWVYCWPLIPFAWINMIMRFSDTWLLQHFGGSVEQAYYAISAQFATISLIATSSILRILWKEIAEAQNEGRYDDVKKLFDRTTRILFYLSVIISGFLIPWVPEIILILLGEKYIAGTSVMILMFFYPIHQSLGQVIGTMFYGLELTKPYVNIGIVFMVVSTFVVYFLLASPDSFIPGLGLGSIGLALKMVLLQFLAVNFSIWWLSRRQGWDFNFLYQFIGILIFISLGFFVYYILFLLIQGEVNIILKLVISGMIYFPLSVIILYLFPNLIMTERSEIKFYFNEMYKDLSNFWA